MEELNIEIRIPEKYKDMYLLCATPDHGYAYNSLIFWGKGNCGYYPDINKCQLYTYEQVMKLATPKEDVPIKLSDLVNHLAIHSEHSCNILFESTKKYNKAVKND